MFLRNDSSDTVNIPGPGGKSTAIRPGEVRECETIPNNLHTASLLFASAIVEVDSQGKPVQKAGTEKLPPPAVQMPARKTRATTQE